MFAVDFLSNILEFDRKGKFIPDFQIIRYFSPRIALSNYYSNLMKRNVSFVSCEKTTLYRDISFQRHERFE